MSELEYNTPLYDKDKRYCQCENCEATGYVYEMIEDMPVKEDCPDCEGTGFLEVD